MNKKNETSGEKYEVNSLTFYKGWHEVAKKFSLTKEEYGEVVYAMCEYCFYGKDTQLEGNKGMMFELTKPSINKSSERKISGYKGGSKGGGGAPTGNKNASKKKE